AACYSRPRPAPARPGLAPADLPRKRPGAPAACPDVPQARSRPHAPLARRRARGRLFRMSPLARAEFQRGISKSPLRSPGPQPRKVASPQNLSTKRSIDGPTTSLLLRGGMIVTQDAGRSLVSGDVLVDDGRIAA